MTGGSPVGPSRRPDSDGPRDFLKYTFYRVDPRWRALPEGERERAKAAAVDVLEHPPEGLRLRTYSTTGLRADADLLVWSIAADLEPIQRLHARLAGTPLGPYLETAYSYLGMGRRSEYVVDHSHGGEGSKGRRGVSEKPYLFVYPFVKKREWYGLPFEERRRIMAEHIRAGHRFPGVEIHTGYSFGLDDMEFILAFGADAPAEFLDLVQELRGTEASRYTALETPIFTCVRAEPRRALDLAGGLP